ncbi:DUF4845 domain-containing protein [Kaarinaea lacus]
MKNYNNQRGVTMITIAAGLALLAFFVLVAITLLPIYIENFSVCSHVSRIGADMRASELTKEEIRKTLIKRFGIDDVKSVAREDISITEIPGGYSVEVDYEVRKHFLGNVDVVVYFTETTEVK